jgi:hypothetical protein
MESCSFPAYPDSIRKSKQGISVETMLKWNLMLQQSSEPEHTPEKCQTLNCSITSLHVDVESKTLWIQRETKEANLWGE